MERLDSVRRLIVNADDFGRSHSANEAIIRAHRDGILTSASLMVNEAGFEEAVSLAKANPQLGVGLHLTLVCGSSTLPPEEIPGLVNEAHQFSNNAVTAGIRYFFERSLKDQLQAEIAAQVAKFLATGLTLDHVNGHLNIHLHPTVFSILISNASRWRIRKMRLTNDPFRLNARLADGNWLYRTTHWLIYRLLSARSRPQLQRSQIKHTEHVFGLLQNARVDESFLLRLLPNLPQGDSELYSHPSLDEFRHELDALCSPRAKALIEQLGIRLIRYQDL
jgi:hopanoid biosynthesis associated protein HpnK